MSNGRGSPLVVDVVPQGETARAAHLLFRGRFDTMQIAALFHMSEPDVVALIHAGRAATEPDVLPRFLPAREAHP